MRVIMLNAPFTLNHATVRLFKFYMSNRIQQ